MLGKALVRRARLRLYAPELPAAIARAGEPASGTAPRWPHLAALLAHARSNAIANAAAEQCLAMLTGASHEQAMAISVAAITAQIDSKGPLGADIMRADPVHLRVEPQGLVLFQNAATLPSAAEADSLIDELNRRLPDLRLWRGTHAGRWYLPFADAARTTTVSPGVADGRPLAGCMPSGPGAPAVTKIMTDIQLVLHDAEVNKERDAGGVPQLNALWLWGGGRVPEHLPSGVDWIAGDDVLSAGLAAHVGIEWRRQVAPQTVVNGFSEHAHQRGLVVLGAPSGAVDDPRSEFDLDDFEHNWCPVLAHALRTRALTELCLVTDRTHYTVTWWRALLGGLRRPRADIAL